MTSDLIRRIWEHRAGLVEGFTNTYGVHMLVYFEQHETMLGAIEREKQIKAGSRRKKIELITAMNPAWDDLYESLL